MRLLTKEETPSDWVSKKIGSYVLGHKGGAALRPNDFSDTGFPVIPKKAIQPTGELLIENPTYCTNEFASNNKRSIVDKSYTITTLRDLVPTGPTIGTVVNFTNEEKYILSQGVYGLKLNDNLDKKYLSYLSNTSFYRKVMQRIMVGSTQVHVRTPEYLDLEIQIPPLLEQQKIVKILTTWDNAICTTERLIENSRQQKKALMQQLLTGKKSLAGFDKEWISEPLGKIVGKIYGGGTPSKNVPEYWNGDIPWVTVKDLVSTKIDGAQQYINESGLENSSANIVPAGTVIIATRMALGKAVIASCDVAINQDLKAITGSPKIDSVFLHYWLLLQAKAIEKLGTGSTVKGVQLETIKSLRMHIPSSIQEQQKIAIVLTNADKEIELLEQQLADLQQEKKALMQQLLTGKRRVVVDEEEIL